MIIFLNTYTISLWASQLNPQLWLTIVCQSNAKNTAQPCFDSMTSKGVDAELKAENICEASALINVKQSKKQIKFSNNIWEKETKSSHRAINTCFSSRHAHASIHTYVQCTGFLASRGPLQRPKALGGGLSLPITWLTRHAIIHSHVHIHCHGTDQLAVQRSMSPTAPLVRAAHRCGVRRVWV